MYKKSNLPILFSAQKALAVSIASNACHSRKMAAKRLSI